MISQEKYFTANNKMIDGSLHVSNLSVDSFGLLIADKYYYIIINYYHIIITGLRKYIIADRELSGALVLFYTHHNILVKLNKKTKLLPEQRTKPDIHCLS